MSSYRPVYTSDSRQSFNSRYDFDRSRHQNTRNHNQSAHQVDSWRSYRNDTTNLQQSVNLNNPQSYYHAASTLNSSYHTSQYGVNPAASTFQPINPSPSRFTPYQPLRISNGEQERRSMQLAGYALNTMVGDRDRHHALLARGSANPRYSLRSNPPSSMEQQIRYSSSIPINLDPRFGIDALRRSIPCASTPPVSSPPAPSPTKEYLTQAALLPARLATPQKLLVVLDLNGTLLKRGGQKRVNFVLRPGVNNFIDYLFANHVVMIYSSARPENVQGMVAKLLSPKQRNKLAAIWARDRLELNSEQYNSKVQVYKKLEKIWADRSIQHFAGKGRTWDQSNTVLLDDSHLKALAQPYNLLRVEEFVNDKPGADLAHGKIQNKEHLQALNLWSANQLRIVKDLENKLEELKWMENVSQLIRQWQLTNPEEQEATSEKSIEPEPMQLMTPMSSELEDSESDQSDGGVDTRQREVDELVLQLGQQCMSTGQSASHDDAGSDRSVSPIDEAIWRDILGGVEQNKEAPPTPKSIDG